MRLGSDFVAYRGSPNTIPVKSLNIHRHFEAELERERRDPG